MTSTATPLKKILNFVWHNKFSDFYRKKYQNVGLNSREVLNPKNFSELPFLTREELELTLPDERLFIKPEDVRFIAYTSGTTSGRPLITYFSEVKNYYFDPSLGLNVKKLLVIHPPINKYFAHTFVQQCRQSKNKTSPIFGDLENLANSAVLAKSIKADTIYSTPTIAWKFAEILKEYYDPQNIKLLALGSETLTGSRRENLKKAYSQAQLANLYGSSEVGQYFLYPCKKIIESGENRFHILEPAVLKTELVEGELVITYVNNKALPLIRYRTGDYFEIAGSCRCGLRGPVLQWAGRRDVERVRIAGLDIKASDAESVFSPISHLTGGEYQLHFYELPGNLWGIKIVIEILGGPESQKFISEDSRRTAIINHLLENWWLTPQTVLREAISRGFLAMPEVKFVNEFSLSGGKTKRLVVHFHKT